MKPIQRETAQILNHIQQTFFFYHVSVVLEMVVQPPTSLEKSKWNEKVSCFITNSVFYQVFTKLLAGKKAVMLFNSFQMGKKNTSHLHFYYFYKSQHGIKSQKFLEYYKLTLYKWLCKVTAHFRISTTAIFIWRLQNHTKIWKITSSRDNCILFFRGPLNMQQTTFFPPRVCKTNLIIYILTKDTVLQQYENKTKIETTDFCNSRLSFVIWCMFQLSWTQITKS